MKKSVLLPLLFFCFTLNAQVPDWVNIKANFKPEIALPNEYKEAYIQPLAVGGWEDGLNISRDGLHMYAFYSPLDVLAFEPYVATTSDDCYNFSPYYRGPLYGMDTVTNPAGCPSWIHSDVVYATRADTSAQFTTWQQSNLATPVTYEGAAQMVPKSDGTNDLFVFVRATLTTNTDIMFMKDVPHNPQDNAIQIPDLTSTGLEENPHIERLDANNLVLFMDNDGEAPADIFYSLSTDNGDSWSAKQVVTTISTDTEHEVIPHLWHDGNIWWIYYAATNPVDGKLGIFRARQTIENDWDSWGSHELVIGAGTIDGGHGQVFAVGEPTLTAWGDISFVAVYGDENSTDSTDMFDNDPWYLPREQGVVASIDQRLQEHRFSIHPNPLNNQNTTIFLEGADIRYLHVFDLNGRLVFESSPNYAKVIIDHKHLKKGVYFVNAVDTSGKVYQKKLIVK